MVLEKPFGTDLASAITLNKQVHKALAESQIYRIDHYLGKETVQNILFTRFANTIFEPIWNRNYIDHVQITVAEKVGVEHRGGFYDSVGILRDMFQNHLLQLLTLVAGTPVFQRRSPAERKVKVLSGAAADSEQVSANTVRGQYKGYHSEDRSIRIHHANVCGPPSSSTTGAGRACLLFAFWQNLAEKQSQIIIQFKEPPLAMFPMQTKPNMLVLSSADEGLRPF